MGDILFDDLSHFPRFNDIIGQIGIHWCNVPGNHEMNLEAARITRIGSWRSPAVRRLRAESASAEPGRSLFQEGVDRLFVLRGLPAPTQEFGLACLDRTQIGVAGVSGEEFLDHLKLWWWVAGNAPRALQCGVV